jgi:hypothetical protein
MSAQSLKPHHLFVVNTAIALGLTGPCAAPSMPGRLGVSFIPTDRNGDALVPLRRGSRNFTRSGEYISPS